MKKFHWSQRYGRSGSYLGIKWRQLLDDNQKLHAQVTVVAQGHRAHVQIHDGKFHDNYWVKDLESGCKNAEMFFSN